LISRDPRTRIYSAFTYIIRSPQVERDKRRQDKDAEQGSVKNKKDKEFVVVLAYTIQHPWAMASCG